MKNKRFFWLLAFGILSTVAVYANPTDVVDSGMTQVADSVKKIGGTAAQVIGGLIGLYAIGRSGWKFSQGDGDSVISLLTGIVAVVLGQVASMFLK